MRNAGAELGRLMVLLLPLMVMVLRMVGRPVGRNWWRY
jgi:hypothetical protein